MHLATIEQIVRLEAHPNADRLEVASILGVTTVVGKGEFKAGEHCVFIHPDTDVPVNYISGKPEDYVKSLWLKERVIRGVISRGVAVRMEKVLEIPFGYVEGQEVGPEIGVKKHESIVPETPGAKTQSGLPFPIDVAPKTDEDDGQTHPRTVAECLAYWQFQKDAGTPVDVIATLKVDGSSETILLDMGEVKFVASRKQGVIRDPQNPFWEAALKLNGKTNFSGVLQGELMGPSTQGNPHRLASHEFHLYQARCTGRSIWIGRLPLLGLAEQAECRIVQEICRWRDDFPSLDLLAHLADGFINPFSNEQAEGIVVRLDPPPSNWLGRPLGFKIMNPRYVKKAKK